MYPSAAAVAARHPVSVSTGYSVFFFFFVLRLLYAFYTVQYILYLMTL